MTKRLTAYLYEQKVGVFTQRSDKRVTFEYATSWLQAARLGEAHALSVKLPLTSAEHDPSTVEAFIAGLLPDSIVHRRILAAELDISDDPSDFAFLSHLGRDCAGAITIIPDGQTLHSDREPSFQVLSESELAEYIRTLPQRPLLVDEEDGVLLSLAGVNDKAAVVVVNKQVALPHYGFPTSHILKPDISALPESIRVEHFCLLLAKECGQSVPHSKIVKAGDQVFMQMARYDRMLVKKDGKDSLARLHQEDFCQALGYGPEKKYERKGGPGWKECFALMGKTENPVEATNALLGRAIFQYLSGNPDAHAKNYSLLYRRDGSTRLSPFYDLNNAAAFKANFKSVKPLMAMAIGGEFNRDNVTPEHWTALAEECGLSVSSVRTQLETLSRRIIEAAPRLRAALKDTIAESSRLDITVDDVTERAKKTLLQMKISKQKAPQSTVPALDTPKVDRAPS